MSPDAIDKDELFATLPPPWPESLLGEIRQRIAVSGQRFVVLDDDPTGGQTLHGMPVLAAWDDDTLLAEVERSPAFFVLTNSRSLSQPEAVVLNEEVGRQLRRVAEKAGRELIVGSRGDSTLRGHYPVETDALFRGLTGDNQKRPTYIVAPYFGEGGRFTVNDTQYVLQGADLVPVAETEFARDPAFAFEHSDLPSWLRARSGEALNVVSVSIDELRRGGPEAVSETLRSIPEGSAVVVNAAAERDIEVFVAGLLAVEAEGRRFLYRTAAAFVRVRAGIDQRPPLTGEELGSATGEGGLIVVGSYVDRTSQQLKGLLSREGVRGVELHVGELFGSDAEGEIARVAATVGKELQGGADVVLFTSRELTRDMAGLDFQSIGQRVSTAICDVLRKLDGRPGFLLVKGGSTACRVAIDSLGVKRAMVLGQLLPGVPVWRLGDESRYPGVPYVVFPGNVGGPDALDQALDVLHGGANAGHG